MTSIVESLSTKSGARYEPRRSSLALPVLTEQAFHRRFETDLTAAAQIRTLQINVGLVCNLACRHCHVESGPKRLSSEENMSAEVAGRILDWLRLHDEIETVDITGGSPEMNPSFRRLVTRSRELGRHVMDRCNPTIITYTDPRMGASYEWIPEFLAEHEVEVVASLPCYQEENVEHQRGRDSYRRSIEGLLRLNAAGYGRDPRLRLNLVFNPNGAQLPPPQEGLQEDYKRELAERFGLVFDELWTITNMPIKRWRRELEQQGSLQRYMQTLVDAFNPETVDGLMCRHQIHVDSQGRLHDCDFNYALDMRTPGHESRFLWEVSADELAGRRIGTADHCYGCTAGAGSSCGGALT